MRFEQNKNALFLLCTAALAMFLASPSHGQWTTFTNNGDIRALYQDGDTLWVGTNGGLLFVDLLSGDVIRNTAVAQRLPDNSIRIIRGRRGKVYVGTDDGLAVFRGELERSHAGAATGRLTDIRNVSFGPTGTMYVATYGHGVGEAGARRVRWTTRVDSLLDNKVFAVAVVDEQKIYYATSLGLCAFLDSVWVSFQAGAGLPRGEVRDLILIDQRKEATGRVAVKIFVLVAGRGVYRFDGRRARRISTSDLFVENDIAAIVLSPDESLWAAGRYGRIAQYREGVWTRFGEGDKSIDAAMWRSAFAGRDGTVFFGSADGLIVAIHEGEVRKISIPSALPSGYVGSMVEDNAGWKYIVNGPYLISTKDDTSGFYVEKDFGSLFAIDVSPDGVVWASGRWGLFRKETDRWVEVIPDIDPKPPLIVSMAFDSTGGFWAGTYEGEIFRFDGDLWIPFAARGELTNGSIDDLLADGHRKLWALSSSRGVFKFDGSDWETFDVSEFDTREIIGSTLNPSGDLVVTTPDSIWTYDETSGWGVVQTPGTEQIGDYRTVHFDRAGTMYLVASQGIAIVSDAGFTWVSPRDEMPGKDVTSILVDKDGTLWVGFRRDGISRISLENRW